MNAFTVDGIGNITYDEIPERQNQLSEGLPQLPKGNSSILRGVSENLSFHSSPEAFIVSRIRQIQKQDPSALDSRAPVRAKILNRNVAIISSYEQIQSILSTNDETDGQSPFVASSAYSQLMDHFFPPPNLLLSDGCPHAKMRDDWDQNIGEIHTSSLQRVRTLITSFWKNGIPLGTPLDMYELMKTLSWRILLDTFLRLRPYDESWLYDEFRNLQEDLLRGQFSLMPVSINARVWRSPRSKGIAARKKLQDLITERLLVLRQQENPTSDGNCDQIPGSEATSLPLPMIDREEKTEEVRDHILMMTSSLAAKGLASLLTAFLLNIWFFEREGVRIFDDLRSIDQTGQKEDRTRLLRSMYLETERLSPPIVGIMRRVSRDAIICGWNGESDTLLPAKWDAWLYFVGAGRDPAVFGHDCMTFDPSRYTNVTTPEPTGFGAGPKACLGKDLIRDIILLTAELFLDSGLVVTGDVSKAGVRAWLGWETAAPEIWAADMKQLPTQRPTAPVYVEFTRV